MSNGTIMEDAAGNGTTTEGQVIDGPDSGTTTEGQVIEEPDSGTIMAGQVIDVPNSDRSGLLATPKLYVRPDVIQLWQALDASSCLVQGAPGVGKSIAVWCWLLAKVGGLPPNSKVLWCHHRQVGPPTYVVVSIDESGGFEFTTVNRKYLEDSEEKFAICVMDGVRQDNRNAINALSEYLDYDRCYWVSSQQVTIPEEQLEEIGWREYSCSSWSTDEINGYAGKFNDNMKEAARTDFIDTMGDAISDPDNLTFEQVIAMKKWFFGGSARYMFGFKMKKSLSDLGKHVSKIDDAEKVLQGLAGARGTLSVNHIIAYFPGAPMEFPLLSEYIIELLSKKLGFAAIKMFYRSSWVKGNPSVHEFVFEWDLLTQFQQNGHLKLSSAAEGPMDVTWTVDKEISLKNFLKDEIKEGRILVRPEKWNRPEYDGLYIYTNEQDERELVAWNASEAVSHSGNVHNLQLLLRELGSRAEDENRLIFDRVRFVFIVPTENQLTFRAPNNLLARVLRPWKFTDFEVFGGTRTT